MSTQLGPDSSWLSQRDLHLLIQRAMDDRCWGNMISQLPQLVSYRETLSQAGRWWSGQAPFIWLLPSSTLPQASKKHQEDQQLGKPSPLKCLAKQEPEKEAGLLVTSWLALSFVSGFSPVHTLHWKPASPPSCGRGSQGYTLRDGQEKAVPFFSLFSVFGFDYHRAGRGCREKAEGECTQLEKMMFLIFPSHGIPWVGLRSLDQNTEFRTTSSPCWSLVPNPAGREGQPGMLSTIPWCSGVKAITLKNLS